MKQISFNTGRSYTGNGQRIVAKRLDCGAILMVDIDRQIDYLLPTETELTQASIMHAYDNQNIIYPNEVNLSYEDYYSILNQLRATAGQAKSI